MRIHTSSTLALSACLLMFAGCSSQNTVAPSALATPDQVSSPLEPQSFSGLLPCASCPGIETQLDLLPDGRYFLTETYQDRPNATFTRAGYWEIDGTRLLLQHEDSSLVFFATDSGGWLQADTEGRPIQSNLNYEIRPTQWAPKPLAMNITGMLIYYADAASVVDCSTGTRFPVEMTDAWLDIERTYLSSISAPGSYLQINADVALNWHTPEEGPANYYLAFNNLTSFTPATTCGTSLEKIEHHEWRLRELAGTFSQDLPEEGKPFVKVSGQQLSGHTGCNTLAGSITLENNRLTLGPVATTRMFCMQTADLETQFLQKLEQATYVSLEGPYWTWYNEDMVRLMSFEQAAPRSNTD